MFCDCRPDKVIRCQGISHRGGSRPLPLGATLYRPARSHRYLICVQYTYVFPIRKLSGCSENFLHTRLPSEVNPISVYFCRFPRTNSLWPQIATQIIEWHENNKRQIRKSLTTNQVMRGAGSGLSPAASDICLTNIQIGDLHRYQIESQSKRSQVYSRCC